MKSKHHILKSLGLVSAMTVFSWLPSITSAEENSCTDYSAIDYAPTLNYPSRSGFRYFWNNWLAKDTPFHMGHDQIVQEGQGTTVIGKFDYGPVFHKDLEYEYVNAYLYGTGMNDWQSLGRYKTNSDGKIMVSVPALTEGQYQVKMVVRGDLSETTAYVTVVKPGAKAVIFDIDETLTASDLEQILDYTGIEAADARGGASELVNHYIARGYHPIFVTGRSYWYAKGSRNWLSNYLGVPDFTLRTTMSNETGLFNVAEYKAAALSNFKAQGIDIFRAYGNASTDIEAYEAAGIPKSDTYIVGKNAGASGTQAISNGHYWDHLNEVAYPNTPHSGCL